MSTSENNPIMDSSNHSDCPEPISDISLPSLKPLNIDGDNIEASKSDDEKVETANEIISSESPVHPEICVTECNDLPDGSSANLAIPSDGSNMSTDTQEAISMENPSSGNSETDKIKSVQQTKSSPTESAASITSSLPVDEDDAGPFNVPAYRRHLNGGNLCYDTFTTKDSQYYEINQGRKLALILNHEEYNHYDNRHIPRRTGTNKDCEKITRVFGDLGFEVEQKNNLRVNEIKDTMFNLQKQNDLACIALFILTHGEENGVLYGYDSMFRLDRHIIQTLLPQNCPSLAGKPKLIFVQACQGSETDDGAMVAAKRIEKGERSRHTSTDGANEYGSNVYCIPNYADLLVFQASYHGHYSFRSGSGTWFIQALCDEVETSGDEEDLNSILTRTSRKVALVKRSNVPSDPELHHKRQIPLKQDTLIRQIYLKKIPSAYQQNGIDKTSKVVDVDKAIEGNTRNSPIKKLQTSLKKVAKPADHNTLTSTEQKVRSTEDKKGNKEKCKVM